jgi:hypothetical protein
VLAYLVGNLLVAGIELDPEAGNSTFPGDLAGIIRRLLGD